MSRILVTGAAGYIGSHVVVSLLNANYEVVAVDNFSNSFSECYNRIETITNKTFKTYDLDVSSSDLENVFRENKIYAVIHLAAYKAVGESCKMPFSYYMNNVGSTLNLLQMMRKYKVFNFVYSSSATVYSSPQYLPLDEDHPTGNCTNPYGKSKFIVEEMLKDLPAENDWKIFILRYFNPVGAHSSGLIGEDPKGIPNNLVPYITQVASGKLKKLSVFGDDYDTIDGTGVRDYIHVMDLAEGHIATMKKFLECDIEKSFSKIYNLGTGTGYSVLQVLGAMEKAVGEKIPYEISARRDGDVASVYTKNDKAKVELGWVAKFNIDDMCTDSWRWQKNNPNGYSS